MTVVVTTKTLSRILATLSRILATLSRILATLRRVLATTRRVLATIRMLMLVLVLVLVPRTMQVTTALRLLELEMPLRIMGKLSLRAKMSRLREMPLMKIMPRSMGSGGMIYKVCLLYSELEVIY